MRATRQTEQEQGGSADAVATFSWLRSAFPWRLHQKEHVSLDVRGTFGIRGKA
jgi:hypothetical protein